MATTGCIRTRSSRSVSPQKRKPRILPWDQSTYKSVKHEFSELNAIDGLPECGGESTRASDSMDISPLRGRTMKEYDQHLEELRKENFDLKLRLYLLEEKMDKKFDSSGKDLHKTNLQLMIDVEVLQKELAEKNTELESLRNSRAGLQRRLQETELKASEEIRMLKDRIDYLEQQISSELRSSHASSGGDDHYEAQIHDADLLMSQKEVDKKATLKILQEKMVKRDKLLRCLIEKAKEREKEISRLHGIMKQNEAAIDAIDGPIQTAIYHATVASRKGDKSGVAEARESLKSAIKEALGQNSGHHLSIIHLLESKVVQLENQLEELSEKHKADTNEKLLLMSQLQEKECIIEELKKKLCFHDEHDPKASSTSCTEHQTSQATRTDSDMALRQLKVQLSAKTSKADETIQQLRKELDDKKEEMLKIMDEARSLKGRATIAENNLAMLDSKYRDAQSKLNDLESKLNKAQEALDHKQCEVVHLEEKISQSDKLAIETQAKMHELTQKLTHISEGLKDKTTAVKNAEEMLLETRRTLHEKAASHEAVSWQLKKTEQLLSSMVESLRKTAVAQGIEHHLLEIPDTRNVDLMLERISRFITSVSTEFQEQTSKAEEVLHQLDKMQAEKRKLEEKIIELVAENMSLKSVIHRLQQGPSENVEGTYSGQKSHKSTTGGDTCEPCTSKCKIPEASFVHECHDLKLKSSESRDACPSSLPCASIADTSMCSSQQGHTGSFVTSGAYSSLQHGTSPLCPAPKDSHPSSDNLSSFPARWRHLMSQKLCKFGRSNDIYQLKEDVCILVLRLEQMERDLQDLQSERKDGFTGKQTGKEVVALQAKLTSSQKLVSILQRRLEDLVEFLEHLLTCTDSEVLKSGVFSPAGVASFHKYLARSRELSLSLTQIPMADDSTVNLDQLDWEPSRETDTSITEKGVLELTQRIDQLISQWEEECPSLKERSMWNLSVSQLRKSKAEDKTWKAHLQNVEQLNQKLNASLLEHQHMNEELLNRLNELPSSKKNLSLHDAALIRKHIETMVSLQNVLQETVRSNAELQDSLKLKLDTTLDRKKLSPVKLQTEAKAETSGYGKNMACQEQDGSIRIENELAACAKELAHFKERCHLVELQLEEKKKEQQCLLQVRTQLEKEVTEIKSLHDHVHLHLKTLLKENETLKAGLENQQHMLAEIRATNFESEKMLDAKCKEIKHIQDWNLKMQKEIEEKDRRINEVTAQMELKSKQLNEKQAELEMLIEIKQSLETEGSRLTQQIASLRAENAEVREKYDDSLHKSLSLSQQYDEVQQELKVVKEKLRNMEARCSQLLKDLEISKTEKAKDAEQLSEKQSQLQKMEEWNLKLQQQFQAQEVERKTALQEMETLRTSLDSLKTEKELLTRKIKSMEEKENSSQHTSGDLQTDSKKSEEVSMLQKKIKEMTQLNKSLQLEMKVYHQLVKKTEDQSASCQTSQDKEHVNESLLMELLGEMRNLRTELSKAIHVNKKLQRQLLLYQRTDMKASQKVPMWLDKCISGNGRENASSHSSSVTSTNTKTGFLGNEQETVDVVSLETLSRTTSQESFTYTEREDAVLANDYQNGNKDGNARIQEPYIAVPNSGAWSEDISQLSKRMLLLERGSTATKEGEFSSSDGSLHERVKQFLGSEGTSSRIDDLSEKEFSLLGGRRDASQRNVATSDDLYPSGSEANSVVSSHHLSPDLGIESDPNRDSCTSALGNQENDTDELRAWKRLQHRLSSHSAPLVLGKKDIFNLQDVSYLQKSFPAYPASKDMEERIKTSHLQALANLEEYELLKKEIGECVVILKGMKVRIKDRFSSMALSNNSSPTKNIEYNTCKELNRSCHMLGLCLEKSWSLVKRFAVIALPMEDSHSTLLRSNSKLKKEIGILKNQLNMKARELQEALEKLKLAENRREGMEKAITKQLDCTRRVLQQARGNLVNSHGHPQNICKILQAPQTQSTPSAVSK